MTSIPVATSTPSASRSRRPALVLFACALGSLGALAPASEPEGPELGAGRHRYRWDANWGALPDDMQLGNTHGCMVVDSKGRVFLNTDSKHAVVIIGADGRYESSWGEEWAGGLHGMTIRREGEQEFLYITHLGRHEVAKTTLDGEVLWTLGHPAESGKYDDANQYRPTAIAVGPDGSLYVADGYGRSWIHQYDAERNYLRSFGGPGQGDGQLQTPHGLWLDERSDPPVLLVADRENHRVQSFSLDGELLGIHSGMLRRPCNLYADGQDLVVADLAGRVTILNERNELVVHIGDNPEEAQRARNDVAPDLWRAGVFVSPHSACFDAAGNLYVMDWLRWGRVSKLERLR